MGCECRYVEGKCVWCGAVKPPTWAVILGDLDQIDESSFRAILAQVKAERDRRVNEHMTTIGFAPQPDPVQAVVEAYKAYGSIPHGVMCDVEFGGDDCDCHADELTAALNALGGGA